MRGNRNQESLANTASRIAMGSAKTQFLLENTNVHIDFIHEIRYTTNKKSVLRWDNSTLTNSIAIRYRGYAWTIRSVKIARY